MSIHYQPWKGKHYEESSLGVRLLILGESGYADPEPDATVRYTTEYANGLWSARFWTIAMQIVTGKHHTDVDRKSFWDNVALYNYVQEPLGDARERPTSQMWANARRPFIDVLTLLKPSHLLALGSALWDNLPDIGRKGPDLEGPVGSRDTWIYPYGDGEVIATWVYHPSSGKANIFNSSPYVEHLLKLSI